MKFYQDKGTLHVIDADGKECKTEIIRQERIQIPKPVSAITPVERSAPRSVENVRPAERPTLKTDDSNGQIAQPNSVEAIIQAAERGDANAQLRIGDLYYRGAGVQQDYLEAARWFRQAADQGQLTAQNNLAFLYFNGQGVPQSYTEAVKWYRVAEKHGNTVSQHYLAMMYLNGQGVARDYVAAYIWADRAVIHSSSPDNEKIFRADRELIGSRMTAEEIAEAQDRAQKSQ